MPDVAGAVALLYFVPASGIPEVLSTVSPSSQSLNKAVGGNQEGKRLPLSNLLQLEYTKGFSALVMAWRPVVVG